MSSEKNNSLLISDLYHTLPFTVHFLSRARFFQKAEGKQIIKTTSIYLKSYNRSKEVFISQLIDNFYPFC